MGDLPPPTQDPAEGLKITEDEDGSAVLEILEKAAGPTDETFEANLALTLDDDELSRISQQLLDGIESDITSRQDWEAAYNRGLDLLGLKIEEATTNVNPQGSVSRVYHPLLLEAVITFQSNAFPELCPSTGPVKVRDDHTESSTPGMMGHNGGPDMSPDRSVLADAFEKDMNHYLTAIAKEYYPDYDRMLFLLALGGCAFRKIYHCPVRKRPVSEFVAAPDLIVSNGTISLTDCGRKTHRIKMRNAAVKRMQATDHWADVPLVQPTENITPTDMKMSEIEGMAATPDLPADYQHTIYESYVELTIEGDTLCKAKYPVPYRVTVDKDSRVILEIRRNWKKNDENYREKRRLVKFPLVPGIGFYDLGYVHILGNTTRSLTAIQRQLLDAGQFSNFPGFLVTPQGQRQTTNQIRVPPGGAQEIDTGGLPINQAVMPLPYKEPSQVLAALAQQMAQDARKLGAAVEIPVGEGKADIPVGTVIAMIEQATKVMSAVHKRLHMSQQEEFEILRELFMEDPSALSRFAKKPARQWEQAVELADIELVPASDPNTPSHLHRLMQSTALVQMAQSAPQLFNLHEVAQRALKVMGIQDIDQVLPPPPPTPPPPPPNPQLIMAQVAQQDVQQRAQNKQAELQLKAQKQASDLMLKKHQQQMGEQKEILNVQTRLHEINADNAMRNSERESRERTERLRTLVEAMKVRYGNQQSKEK